jgi:hypothetical protein
MSSMNSSSQAVQRLFDAERVACKSSSIDLTCAWYSSYFPVVNLADPRPSSRQILLVSFFRILLKSNPAGPMSGRVDSLFFVRRSVRRASTQSRPAVLPAQFPRGRRNGPLQSFFSRPNQCPCNAGMSCSHRDRVHISFMPLNLNALGFNRRLAELFQVHRFQFRYFVILDSALARTGNNDDVTEPHARMLAGDGLEFHF